MATDESANSHSGRPLFDVAIVGGGLIGLHVALGLVRRNIPVTVYEQALELKEIGAGVGFSFNIVECMNTLDPRINKALAKIAVKSGSKMHWIDGFSQEDVRRGRRTGSLT